MRYAGLSIFMLAALCVSVQAEVLKLDKVSVDLALPEGYCKLSRSDPKDKLRYDQQDQVQGERNLVLMLAVPCNELAASREGKLWQHWAVWLQTGGSRPIDASGKSRTEVFTEVAKSIPAVDLKEISDDVNGRSKKQGIDVKPSSAGTVGQDGNGLYVAMVGDTSSAKVKRTIANIIAFTVLSGRVFTFNLLQDYENSKTFDALLVSAKDIAQRSTTATDALRTAQ